MKWCCRHAQGTDRLSSPNRLLAAVEPETFALLEPHLEIVELSRGEILYETGDVMRFAYFPHNATVTLVNMMEDGSTVEVAMFGREGVIPMIPTPR